MILRRLAPAILASLAFPLTAHAMSKVKIDEDTNIELGLRVQAQLFSTEADVDPSDPGFETQNSFLIRRARVRVRANYKTWLTGYVQTDYEEQGGTSSDLRIIDAYVLVKPHPLAWIYFGQNMVPAQRSNVTSSGAFMAIDRPGITYKTLSWGARSKYAFNNTSFADGTSKLAGLARAPVRDLGATLFGNQSFSKDLHLKYYLGAYDGVQGGAQDNFRLTGRVQLNLFGKEGGYYNDGTYLGEKRTVGIGASYDTQKAVAIDQATTRKVTYKLYSLDGFTEMPLPVGSLTGEIAYTNLDLGGGGALATSAAPGTALGNAAQSQGDGFYGQVGYYVSQVQPWVGYEQWNSDASDDRGSYKAYRAGLNYYLKGTDVKLVAGWERFEPKVALAGGAQKTVQSFILGFYLDV